MKLKLKVRKGGEKGERKGEKGEKKVGEGRRKEREMKGWGRN